MLESGASSWGHLHLGNQSLVFTEERLKLSLGFVKSWVWDSVADVLDHLVLGNSDKSLVVLLDNVESGLKFTQFGSEVGVVSYNRVELAVVVGSDLCLQSTQLSSELVVLGVQVGDVAPVVVDSVV